MTDLTTLTDTELATQLSSAEQLHRQLECSGAAYSNSRSSAQASNARSQYYALWTEADRRKEEAA